MLVTRWTGATEPVRLLALAMPLYAGANLFGPAVNALGRPRVQLGNAVIGLERMPAAFWIGSSRGAIGIAAAWALAYPLLFADSAPRSLGVTGASARALAGAVLPATFAALAIALALLPLARLVPLMGIALIIFEIVLGAPLYALVLRAAFPDRVREAIAVARPGTAQAAI